MGPGVVLGHRHIPVANVGAYVPGGRYPMLASSFMTVLVAKVAGVETVVACAPPQREGGIHPAMLYAMKTSGADVILCLGGVQALAAMAFGAIDGIEPIDMLVGAGNAYVAEAKRQLYGRVGIDLLAGPTEVLVIADGSADPRLVAADLLGQAEHGPTSPAGLIAVGEDVGKAVLAEVDDLLRTWPTADVAGEAWREHGWVAVAADDDEAIRISDDAAYEHLEVQVEEPKLAMYLERLRNYGSLFLGEGATVAYGDKAIGTNHVLPTLRGARYTGGLWVGQVPQDLHLPAGHRRGHAPDRPGRRGDLRGRALRRPRAHGDDAARAGGRGVTGGALVARRAHGGRHGGRARARPRLRARARGGRRRGRAGARARRARSPSRRRRSARPAGAPAPRSPT